jgi:hypothetical protein
VEAHVLGVLGGHEVGAPVANVCPRVESESVWTTSASPSGSLWTDDELCGRIYGQAANLSAGELLGEPKPKFYEHVFAAMHKLAATRYHLDNYARLEREHAQKARRLFKKQPHWREEAFELIFELEAFLLQAKSSLDMLAKLVSVAVGKGTIHVNTYGDAGDKLVKGLEQYRKRKNANQAG